MHASSETHEASQLHLFQPLLLHSEASAIRLLPHTRAHTRPQLGNAAVIDREERVCPSHPDSMAAFALLDS